MANIKCGIYKITNPKGKIYIGQSVHIYRRICAYRNLKCENQTKLYASLCKYGWDKHKFDIIHICDPEQLNQIEAYYIALYNSFNGKFGLNLRNGGGSRGELSEETRRRIGDSKRGRKVVFSETHRKRLSESAKKRGMPQDVIEKGRRAAIGRKQSPETLKKRFSGRIFAKGSNHTMSKAVFQYSLTGELIKRWPCLSDIFRELGFSFQNISACCRGRLDKAYGFKWKYSDI